MGPAFGQLLKAVEERLEALLVDLEVGLGLD
jgi:hypothetical protein